jgi:hypothetical protein
MPLYLLNVVQRNSSTAHMCEGSSTKAMRAHPFNPQVVAVFAGSDPQVVVAQNYFPVSIL